jgi:CheY-like chemotaxis protein
VHEMQKLESLGHLTGGLAHDFNNVLMAVLGNLNLVAKQLPEGIAAKALVGGAIDAAERGASLTQRMLAFARRQELRPESVDVPHLVQGMADMLRRSLGPAIEIGMEFQDELTLVRVDPNQLELALLNLALNGRDAMPEGGRLTIVGRMQRVEAGDIQGLRAGEFFCIAVTDNGIGMDDATVKRAQEPFFTTKDVGKGTGLGLSMVYGLATQSGGATRINSRLGAGTTVELLLPIAATADVPQVPASGQVQHGLTPSCTILLVDDDSLVSEVTAAMLEDLGHDVVAVSSATHALDVIRSDARIDLVITDHAMPGMTGMELARHIRAMRIELPIILATGYAELPNSGPVGIPRLDKPYCQEKLASMIASIVGQRETILSNV